MSAPTITINGYRLTPTQSLAIQMALSDLYVETELNPDALGRDDIAAPERARLKIFQIASKQVLLLMGTQKETAILRNKRKLPIIALNGGSVLKSREA